MRKYSIYIIRNKVNDKVYIGQTCQSIEERFRQHIKPSTIKKRGSYKIYNAIAKYGKDNFYIELIEDNIEEKDIDEKEIYYIQKYNSYKKGYNSTNGGDSKTICKIEDIDLLKKLFYERKTFQEIANVFDVNKVTVERTLHSLKLFRNKTISKEYLLNNPNKTNVEIAKEFNVCEYTVSRALKRYGIKRGKGYSNKITNKNRKSNKKCIDYPVGE